ncbi:hypothetical protein BDY21DRAFT_281080 [Lineolata rhizophorae]|uniref:G-patch domain-containing protein n=1 Tax=Lineolata rhizophorae TaxID=578093 RepID=A0A6A6P7I8_9PEZI|nr:hypothetical protein BDY21DRAFT_281080 [Lineolata rhizophorae]
MAHRQREPSAGEASDDEDDYMAMSFAEPDSPAHKETSMQRRARRVREGEIKGRVKSKAEREADAAAAQEEALATALDDSNKGFRMMAKLGYKRGAALGKSEGARTEPIKLSRKDDRGGIGLEAERKRKLRDEAGNVPNKAKFDEWDYRDRMAQEAQERRIEGQIFHAQRMAETLDTEEEAGGNTAGQGIDSGTKPLTSCNVLWRGLVLQRQADEEEQQMRRERDRNLSRFKDCVYSADDGDSSDDDEHRNVLEAKLNDRTLFDEQDDEPEADPELEEFNSLPPAERLTRLLVYLRDKHHYCFWCKCKYPDFALDGCPGVDEEDHD